jgi:hypothetical protein
MGTFITLLVIGLIIYLIVKASSKSTDKQSQQQITKKTELPIEIKVTTSYSSGYSSQDQNKFYSIKQDKDGNWILNPGAPLELTALSKNKELVLQVRDLLDNDEIRDYRKDDKLIAIFAEHNLKIKEIEEYKNKYKSQYLNKIQELINNSSEWEISGEKDKEDIMIEFRQEAIKGIYERANCDLEILFESEPKDITLDDELIKDYGFENIRTYLRYADKLDIVRVVRNDDFLRPIFEKLAEQGLADRGSSLTKDEILTTLTLKELNVIAQNPDKEYKRKNQAIEYVTALPDIDERIGKHISMRELFRLRPLPEKYNSLNLKEVADTWNFHNQEVRLLMDTFRNSFYSWRDLKDKEYVKGYKVEPLDKEDPCPCSKDLANKKFTKNNPPRIPYHIGCNCFLNKEYNFD